MCRHIEHSDSPDRPGFDSGTRFVFHIIDVIPRHGLFGNVVLHVFSELFEFRAGEIGLAIGDKFFAHGIEQLGEIHRLAGHHGIKAVEVVFHERLIFVKRKTDAGTARIFFVSTDAVDSKAYRQLVDGAVCPRTFDYVREIIIRTEIFHVGREVHQIAGFIEPAEAVGVKKDVRAFAVDDVHGKGIALACCSLYLNLVPVVIVIDIVVGRIVNKIAGFVSIGEHDVILAVLFIELLDRSTDNFIHITRIEFQYGLSGIGIFSCSRKFNDLEIGRCALILRPDLCLADKGQLVTGTFDQLKVIVH